MEFKPSRSHRQLLNRWILSMQCFPSFWIHVCAAGIGVFCMVHRIVPWIQRSLRGSFGASYLDTNLNGLFRNLDERKLIQKQAAVPKMPPFTTLADAVHLAEGDMHPDLDSVHSFEVRLQSPAITFLMFHSRLFWSLPPIPLKSSHCSKNTKGKFTTMWETPLQVSNDSLCIPLCRLLYSLYFCCAFHVDFLRQNLFRIQLHQGIICRKLMDLITSYTSLMEYW